MRELLLSGGLEGNCVLLIFIHINYAPFFITTEFKIYLFVLATY